MNLSAVESAGVTAVPADATHGRPRDLFRFWFAANTEFASLSVGALGTGVFGLGAGPAFAAILLGNLVGAGLLAACSLFGVAYGRPQMIQGRAWFGARGNRAPALVNFLCGLSWFAVNTILGGYGLAAALGVGLVPGIVALSAAQTAIVVFGHDLVQATERALFWVLLLLFLGLTGFVVGHVGLWPAADPGLVAANGGGSGAFLLFLSVVLANALGWIPYSADYTRYLDPGPDPRAVRRSIAIHAFLGAFVSMCWIETVGALLGTGVALTTPAQLFTDWIPSWFRLPLALAVVLGTVTSNIVSVYSATLSGLAVGLRLAQWQMALLAGVAGGVLALSLAATFFAAFQSFLLLLGAWTMPWAAICLIGHFGGRRPRPRMPDAGVLAWVVGIAAGVPFMNQPLLVGPVARALPQLGDVSLAASATVAAVLFLALSRPAAEGFDDRAP